MHTLTKLVIISMAGSLLCNGCSNAKKTLGLSRTAPDEFTVVSRAPLTLPPEYTLTPPLPGAVNPKEGTTSEAARRGLFVETAALSETDASSLIASSSDESLNNDKGAVALLSEAGALHSDPTIRQTIQNDSSVLIEEDKEFIDKLVFWRQLEDPTSVAVDAHKEKQRIQEVQALGKPINEGETPSIARKKKALLDF